MNILFSVYLKNLWEARFFIKHSLPSMEFGYQEDKCKLVIFATKDINDWIYEQNLRHPDSKVDINLENVHPQEPDKPDWYFETVYFKLAVVAYAEFIDQQWWCPLKANVVYTPGSWKNVYDYMRGNSVVGFVSKAPILRYYGGNVLPLHEINSLYHPHAFVETPYFSMKLSDGIIYHEIKGYGVLQTAFVKWPVAIKCVRNPHTFLHRVDKDFMHLYFKKDENLSHLASEEFGWFEYVKDIPNRGFQYKKPADSIREWVANGFNCDPIHHTMGRTHIPIWWRKPDCAEAFERLKIAEEKAKRLIDEVFDVN